MGVSVWIFSDLQQRGSLVPSPCLGRPALVVVLFRLLVVVLLFWVEM